MKKLWSWLKFDKSIISQKMSLPVRASLIFASWFYSGFLKPFSGSWGSLFAIPAAMLIGHYLGASMLIFFIIFTFIWGWFSVDTLIAHKIGAHDIKPVLTKTGIKNVASPHDPNFVVIDEVCGQSIALLPIYLFFASPYYAIPAFFLFRFFDMIKLWPSNFFDTKVENGVGVMTDDVFAGLYAAIILGLILTF
jgi:phosphatidylglycerophosphatase A